MRVLMRGPGDTKHVSQRPEVGFLIFGWLPSTRPMVTGNGIGLADGVPSFSKKLKLTFAGVHCFST
jgi:hypothetical protein